MALRVINLASVLFVTLCVNAAAIGQTRNPNVGTRGVRVLLKLEVSGTFQHTDLMITNGTSDKIPKGTKVYWEINPQEKGSCVLPKLLAPGDSHRLTVETHSLLLINNKAWYFKTGP